MPSDTLKIVEGAAIQETPDRSHYWAVQTPQIFSAATLIAAYAAAEYFAASNGAPHHKSRAWLDRASSTCL